jgi:hypothetical protein
MDALDVYRESSFVDRESSAMEDTQLSVALVGNVVPNILCSSSALKNRSLLSEIKSALSAIVLLLGDMGGTL